MLETFLLSYKLKTTYITNSVIYSLKQIPLIGKTISDACYTDKTLIIIAYIISSLKTILWDILIKKFLYIIFMYIMIPSLLYSFIYDINLENLEITIPILTTYVFLTVIGGFMNNDMFKTSKDKYYAIITMKIDAKKYIITNYISNLLKTMLGILIATLVFTIGEQMSIITLFLLPVYLVLVKIIFTGLNILHFKKTERIISGSITNFFKIIVSVILLFIAYILPIFNIEINENIFYLILAITFVLAIKGAIEIIKFNDYKRMYKVREIESEALGLKSIKYQHKKLTEQVHNQIDIGEKFESKKTGYAFFNKLFINRHKKIIEKAIKIETIIIIAMVIVLIGVIEIINDPGTNSSINVFLLNSLPYFTLIMFWLNRSATITQAMYMNCDHSMLTYKFYRTPKAILGLFKERLKTLIAVNLIPAGILAIELPAILLLSGGTDNPLNYLVLFVSIISMSIFFSIHHLVIYYLLQPYTKESELKGASYKVVQSATYLLCYFFSDLKMDTTVFGLCMIAFSIGYIFISMFLVYKNAPKTFKIRN
ncbi:MAG: hypothetical protein IKN65_04170 [Clostridia bacterium]|nr:hypothetical protein [Clostridia bacterium]